MDTGEQNPADPTVAVRRCAVCNTIVTDANMGRCPECHSRYIRVEGEPGAAGLSIQVRPTAPPPPSKRPAPVIPAVTSDVAGAFGLVAGGIGAAVVALLAMTALSSFVLGGMGMSMLPDPIMLALMLMLVLGGVAGVCVYVRHVRAGARATGRTAWVCPHCHYTMETMHTGRCPECGRLPDPMAWSNYRCPGCRRDLHDYHGDLCPECGTDVRQVTDAPPEDDEGRPIVSDRAPTVLDVEVPARGTDAQTPPLAPSPPRTVGEPGTSRSGDASG